MHGIFDEKKSKADPDAFPSLLRHVKPNLNKRKTLPQTTPLPLEESKTDTVQTERLSLSQSRQQPDNNQKQSEQEIQAIFMLKDLQQSQILDSALSEEQLIKQSSANQDSQSNMLMAEVKNEYSFEQEFDELHRRIFYRKQQSESPKRQTQLLARMITDLQTDENQSSQDVSQSSEGPLLRRLRVNSQTKLSLRLKSEGFQTVDQLFNYRKLTVFVKQQKDTSNFEILDVRRFINIFLEIRDCEQYDQLLVEVSFKLCSLIDEFVACTHDALILVGFQACKQQLTKFENLKAFYSSHSSQLQKQDVCVLNYVFSQVRFIFSRFGRAITVYESIAAKYKMTQMKEGPQQKQVNRINSKSVFQPTDITTDTSLPLVLLTDDEKSEVVIKQHFMVQRAVWREQLDQEKAQLVPTIVCRVCGQKFYADKTTQHSTFCIKKTEKIKEQRKLNQQFLQMSSKATETMLLIQQESVFNSKIGALLQTPTLQRRAFMAPKQIEVKTNANQQTNQLKPINVLAQYAINPLASKQLDSRNEGQDSKQDTSIGSFRSLPKNLKDNNGNPLMTPQPSRQQFQLNQIGLTALNKPEPQKQPLNYFNALAGIRRDVVPVPVAQQNQNQQTPQKNSKVTALTPASQTNIPNKDQTPKPTLKIALEKIINTKLPKSPYVNSYQSRYRYSTVTQSSTRMHTQDPSCCSVKQGKRTDYWRKIQSQIQQPVPNKDNIETILQNFEILNKGLIQRNPLDKRYQILIEPKIPKVKEEIVKLETKKFAKAFEDQKSFIPICASPLITSSGRFTRPQQNQNNQLNFSGKPGLQDEKNKVVKDPWGNQANSKMVSATPCISSNNSRLQGKQDMDSLEAIKTMSNDAFNISINTDPISFQQQQEVFKLQSQKIAQLLTNSTLNMKTSDLLQEYKALVLQNIDFLTQLVSIERSYMSTLPNAALKIIHNQEEIAQTKVKKIIDQMEPGYERNFSKSKSLQVDSLIVRRQKKKKLDKGVSQDSLKTKGIENATRSNSQKVINTIDARVKTDINNLKLGLHKSKDILEVIPEKVRSKQSTPKAKKIKDVVNCDKSKFAQNKDNSGDEEDDESAGEDFLDANISDLGSDQKIGVLQTFLTKNTDLEMSFLFQKQLEEPLPVRPYKPEALRYITAPVQLKIEDEDFDKYFQQGINRTRRLQQETLHQKQRKQQAQKFRLTKGLIEFDIDSFSSQSYKSSFSGNSDLPILNYKLRSKSDIVIGTNLFEKRETISSSIKQSEFNDLVYVQNLILNENKSSQYESSSQSGSSESSSMNQEQLLTMEQVRFNSCSILPTHLESCRIDKQITSTQPVKITDFALLKTLSWGAYGRVILSRKQDTKDLFAIKVMDKAAMVHLNVADFVMNERNVLNQIDCDFIVRGMYTFQTQKYLYMVMEYMRGGDFGNLLEKCGSFNFETSKFYLAHIVAGLEHLHSKGIVHRDLKPENMLIGADGHIKLTDFGLSDAGLKNILNSDQSNDEKVKSEADQKDKKYRVVGTADYMAPEVIKGHDVSILMDFWSLGIIAYEFLLADLPFNCDTPEQIFRNVLQKPIELPPPGFDEGQIHPDARDFIDQLLQRDPQKRLGSKNGIRDLKDHPFFSGINWKTLIREPAPWVPPPAKDLDMTNFPKAQQKEDPGLKKLIEEEGLDAELVPVSTPKLNVREFNQFNGVSYNALKNINQMESEKALKWAQRQLKKMKESGQEIKQTRFGDADSITAVTRKAPHLRSISVDRKKIVRPF